MNSSLDRRSLLRRGGLLAAGAATAAPLTGTASATAATDPHHPSGATELTTRDPLVEQRADPCITPPVNGMYYMTGSVPEYDRLVVRGAPTIDGLAHTRERTVWRRPESGRTGGHIWAPELHRIDGRWYIYFAAGDSDDETRMRMYVLESAAADPREDAWSLRGRITTGWDSFSLDATTFEHRGKRYYVWAQREQGIDTNSNLYIAEMSSPLAIRGDPVRIAVPTREWETRGFAVNEGPAVIVRNGRVFMTFSASATDANYCMGLLTADARSDLLDPKSWSKSPEPVFTTNDNTGRFGPGHNTFTVAEDGETDVLVYHCRDYREIEGNPLYDPNRHARVQRLHWNDDGTPAFGVPVGDGGTALRFSPLDAPDAYVRHHEQRLRVGGAGPLADTQFRFVPGFLGPDRVALQSVDLPDHHVRVRGGSLEISPYQDSDDYGRATGFVRTPGLADRRGVSLRVSDDTYVVHDDGRLTTGRPRGRADRERATFLLG
ncbi:GH43 family beta-xylosidase [Saccharopolyspora lacisalsi]|uniref:GH43 family beta-xylosidase n=1 Tax=Halosaccharopolyspora lacisalsi TaxID=1000566 RepID=A0A839DSM9_9PSEU|nr:family 43 glycosylhydrolase [Halosaccharopolyspora lacisalsi]MBA8823749.1 GH43 family beta-xylosidase [Halosaccharopolyspora lacisalsi]